DIVETDFLDKTNRTVRSAKISILIHFKRKLYTELLRMASEFANSLHGLFPDSRVIRVLRPVNRPEPQCLFLCIRQRFKQSEGNAARADLFRRVDNPMPIGQIFIAALGVDHTAP